MAHLVSIRGGGTPDTLVLIREGVNTLNDSALRHACELAHEVMGIHGFSTLELPSGDYEALARLRPLLRRRPRIMVCHGRDLIAAGFPLLPTLDFPHWTVVVAEPTGEQFAIVRALFSEPIPNPTYLRSGD